MKIVLNVLNLLPTARQDKLCKLTVLIRLFQVLYPANDSFSLFIDSYNTWQFASFPMPSPNLFSLLIRSKVNDFVDNSMSFKNGFDP